MLHSDDDSEAADVGAPVRSHPMRADLTDGHLPAAASSIAAALRPGAASDPPRLGALRDAAREDLRAAAEAFDRNRADAIERLLTATSDDVTADELEEVLDDATEGDLVEARTAIDEALDAVDGGDLDEAAVSVTSAVVSLTGAQDAAPPADVEVHDAVALEHDDGSSPFLDPPPMDLSGSAVEEGSTPPPAGEDADAAPDEGDDGDRPWWIAESGEHITHWTPELAEEHLPPSYHEHWEGLDEHLKGGVTTPPPWPGGYLHQRLFLDGVEHIWTGETWYNYWGFLNNPSKFGWPDYLHPPDEPWPSPVAVPPDQTPEPSTIDEQGGDVSEAGGESDAASEGSAAQEPPLPESGAGVEMIDNVPHHWDGEAWVPVGVGADHAPEVADWAVANGVTVGPMPEHLLQRVEIDGVEHIWTGIGWTPYSTFTASPASYGFPDYVAPSSGPGDGEVGATLIDGQPYRWDGEQWVWVEWRDLSDDEWSWLKSEFGTTEAIHKLNVQGYVLKVGDYTFPAQFPPTGTPGETAFRDGLWYIWGEGGHLHLHHEPPWMVEGVRHIWDGEQWVPEVQPGATDPSDLEDPGEEVGPEASPLEPGPEQADLSGATEAVLLDEPSADNTLETAEVENGPDAAEGGDPGLDQDLDAGALDGGVLGDDSPAPDSESGVAMIGNVPHWWDGDAWVPVAAGADAEQPPEVADWVATNGVTVGPMPEHLLQRVEIDGVEHIWTGMGWTPYATFAANPASYGFSDYVTAGTTTVVDGDPYQWDGEEWVAVPPESGVTMIGDVVYRFEGEQWVPIEWGDLTQGEWATLAENHGGFSASMERRGVEWYESPTGSFYQVGDHRSPVFYPPKGDGAEGIEGGRQWVISDGKPVLKHEPPEFVDGVKHVWDGEQWIPHLHTDGGWVPAQWDGDQLVPASDLLDTDAAAEHGSEPASEVDNESASEVAGTEPADLDPRDPRLHLGLDADAEDPRRPDDPSVELHLDRLDGRPQIDPILFDVADARDTEPDGPPATLDPRPTFGAGDHRALVEDGTRIDAGSLPPTDLPDSGSRPSFDDGGLRPPIHEDLALAPEATSIPDVVADGSGSSLRDDTTDGHGALAGRWTEPTDEHGLEDASDDGLLDV